VVSSTNVISLKEGDKVTFGDEDTIYIIESFEFNQEAVGIATLCRITIREMSKEATTETEKSTGETPSTEGETETTQTEEQTGSSGDQETTTETQTTE
jgi:hypothetical protein